MAPALLTVESLRVEFAVRGGSILRRPAAFPAVDGVSFELAAGETLGLVGESGSGKSTVGRAAIRLITPTSGRVLLDGRDLAGLAGDELRAIRRHMQIVFQDPAGSMNPRRTIGDWVVEPIAVFFPRLHRSERRRRTGAMLERCGIPAAWEGRYPHELSGGQRQRVAIARALASEPRLVVCDEPTSALDVSVQAQILNLLGELQRDLGLAYLFISHDLGVVQHVAHRIAVMQRGRLVEIGARDSVLDSPVTEYTRRLLGAAVSSSVSAAGSAAGRSP